MTLPLTTSAGAIPRFLNHIREAGVPSKVTNPYLKSVGFKSSNDAALIGVFKALGFIDASGTPTATWKAYRDVTKGKAVLASSIKKSYAGLFQIYADANRKDDEAVANWIRSNTSLGGITVDRAVRTFKALCNEADFAASEVSDDDNTATNSPKTDTAVRQKTVVAQATVSPNININIELHMPATNDSEVYENFFASMKKHLFHEQ